MRVKCPHCHRLHDIPIRAVLAEAERLRQIRAGRPASAAESLPEADGNTLSPEEIAERMTITAGVDKASGRL